MKNQVILFSAVILFFFSIPYVKAQTQVDTAKVKPKYEYAFLTYRLQFDHKSTYMIILEIDYENGKYEKFYEEQLPDEDSGRLYEHYGKLFKAFDYLGTMRYELVSSGGKWDISDGMHYIFRRERK